MLNFVHHLLCPPDQVKGLSDLLKSNLEKGVSPNEDELLQRKNVYGSNTYPRKKRKNILVFYKYT
jgi:P-type Ca2+ transporter type 2C